METVLTQKTAEERELRMRVLRLAQETEEFELAKARYEEEKQNLNRILAKYFETYGYSKAKVDGKDENISLTLVQPRKITWDIGALKKVLDKDIIPDVISKEITITDFETLKQLLKKHSVSFKDFRKCVEVREELNQDAFNNMCECGWIDKKSLKGTYKVKAGTEYIKMTRSRKTRG